MTPLPLPAPAGVPAVPPRGEAPPDAPPAAASDAPAAARRAVRAARTTPPDPPASHLPVASVAVDLPLAHLDRPFDYLVGESQSASAVPGARVRVRFAGQDVAGYVLERCERSEYGGRLARLSRVTSPEPVLSPEIAALARLVADRWAGTLADVLRLALPPRHARVEKETPAEPPAGPVALPVAGPWGRYPGGAALLDALAQGAAPRAAWSALPGEDWPLALATAARAALAGGRGAVLVVPDQRDVDRVDAALASLLGPGRHVALTAELGPAERYRRWLAVRRGSARVVVGTRAATYAPVADLGLVAIWDDGDDLHVEPRAPYPHSRDVLTLRAHQSGAAALLGGFTRSAEVAALVAGQWARPIAAGREVVRLAAPRIVVAADDIERERDAAAASARLPSLAWRTAREALERGPVLVQVPRRGYLPGLACGTCRAPARCAVCHGPLALAGRSSVPHCGWCGRPASAWSCPVCSSTALRAVAVGSRRTAEELGRAFPGVTVRTSGRDGVVAAVRGEPALVVATPGAEPVAHGGYAAALLLDGAVLLRRADLRAHEEALRRWAAATALVRPAADGGAVVVMAESGVPAVQALVRWDPAGFADRELAERTTLHFPPAARVAVLTGTRAAVSDLLAAADLPAAAQVLGPVPLDDPAAEPDAGRAIVRVPRSAGAALAAALRTAQALRSARKEADHVRVRIDPLDLA